MLRELVKFSKLTAHTQTTGALPDNPLWRYRVVLQDRKGWGQLVSMLTSVDIAAIQRVDAGPS